MKNLYLFIVLCLFSAGYAQNPADRDPNFNQFYTPLGHYFIPTDIEKNVVSPNGKLFILARNIESLDTGQERFSQITILNNNIFENRILFDNGEIMDYKFQSDGKLLVYGSFTSYNSQPVKNVVRFNSDLTLDNSFNLDSSITCSFNFNTRIALKILLQSDNKIIIGGYVNCAQGLRSFIRINSNGSFDNSFNSVVSQQVDHIAAIQPDNKILVSKKESSSSSDPCMIFRLNLDGSLDNTFAIGSGFSSSKLNKIVVLTNGQIVAIGNFSTYNGQFIRSRIVKINQDGTLDSSFNQVNSSSFAMGFSMQPYIISRQVNVIDIIEQPDGKLIAVGLFNSYDSFGINCQNIVRMESNGVIDPTFNVTLDIDYTNYDFTGLKLTDTSLAFDSQSRLYISGSFKAFNNQSVNNIVRVNLDGNIDSSFDNFCKGFDGNVSIIKEFNDGKILCLGSFKKYNGIESTYLIKLNQDGTIDNSFTSYFDSRYNPIKDVLIQEDGKVLLIGNRTTSTSYSLHMDYAGIDFKGILRLNQDGTVDTTFNYGNGIESPTSTDASLLSAIQQSDGKILLSGYLVSKYKGQTVRGVFRILPNGDIDTSFQYPSGEVSGFLYFDSSEKIFVNSSSVSMEPINIKRFNYDGSVDNTFAFITGRIIGVQQDDRIMVLDRADSTTPNFVKRYFSDGTLDNTYQSFSTGNYPEKETYKLLPDNKIIFCEKVNGNNVKILRVDQNGVLDNSFNVPVGVDCYGSSYPANDLKVFPFSNGKIMVGSNKGFYKYNNVEQWNILRLLGNNYYTVTGTNLLDFDLNGCDLNDLRFKPVKFVVNNTLNYITNNSGDFIINFSNEETYTLVPEIENPDYFSISPNSLTIDFPNDPSPYVQNFCITPMGNHPDLEIVMLPLNSARPGFDSKYKLLLKNKGNQLQNGTISLSFNDNVLDLVASNPLQDSQSGNILAYNFSNLLPIEMREITLIFNANTSSESPPLYAGNVLTFNASVSSSLTDETPNDNVFDLNQTVVNSYDPNDKNCLQGENVTLEVVGEYVHYVIRFENTGTYNAQNITVTDYIDTDKFDISTLVPLNGSHLFITKISEGNKVDFIFENINLPFNDATNDGYVAFKIKTKPSLVIGDTFSNAASIYFDYNSAINTNEFVSTIQALSTQDFSFGNYFSLYPNPVYDVLNISKKGDVEISTIHIYNVMGQLILIIPNAKNISTIDVSSLSAGNYFVKINSDKGTSNTKFIKK